MNRRAPALAVVLLAGLAVPLAHGMTAQAGTSDCKAGPYVDAKLHVCRFDPRGELHLRLGTLASPVTVTLAAYRSDSPPAVWPQTLVDSATKTLQPGDDKTLHVHAPDCSGQVDGVLAGTVPTYLTGGYFGSTLIPSTGTRSAPCVSATPSASATPTSDSSPSSSPSSLPSESSTTSPSASPSPTETPSSSTESPGPTSSSPSEMPSDSPVSSAPAQSPTPVTTADSSPTATAIPEPSHISGPSPSPVLSSDSPSSPPSPSPATTQRPASTPSATTSAHASPASSPAGPRRTTTGRPVRTSPRTWQPTTAPSPPTSVPVRTATVSSLAHTGAGDTQRVAWAGGLLVAAGAALSVAGRRKA